MILALCTLRRHEVAYPTPFEAVLGTERALSSKFQTCRTLQGTSVIWAVQSYALLRLSRAIRHDGASSGR